MGLMLTSGSFSALAFLHPVGIWKHVAVPSRLYTSPTIDKPLAGKRIINKDNYRLAGVKTTLSSRPYEATYGPDQETAEFVKCLLALGAVVVGKSKMSAFASSEAPTDQWVDFHAPFNPRGDGYKNQLVAATGQQQRFPVIPGWTFQLEQIVSRISEGKLCTDVDSAQHLEAFVTLRRYAVSTGYAIRHTLSRWMV